MTTLRKTITATALVALLAGTITTTPASAWYYGNNDGAAIAGAMIGGMALGAAVGTLVSQPNYNYGYGGGYGTGYGYGPGYANGYGYGYEPRPHTAMEAVTDTAMVMDTGMATVAATIIGTTTTDK